jgi:hypothetical protein
MVREVSTVWQLVGSPRATDRLCRPEERSLRFEQTVGLLIGLLTSAVSALVRVRFLDGET